MITLAISELVVLAGMQFLLYAAEGAVPDHFVVSLRLDNVQGGMLLWMPTYIWNVLSRFGSYKVGEKMGMDRVLVALSLYRVTKNDWSSSGGSKDVFAYNLFTGTVRGCRADTTAPVKLQNIDDGPIVPVMVPVVDVNWLPGAVRETISEVNRD